MSVVDTVEILKAQTLTAEEYEQAAVLGWCVELVRSLVLMMNTVHLTMMAATSLFPRRGRHYG